MSNLFYNLFEEEIGTDMEYQYTFLYFRISPRGNCKFGVTHLPWERLRMQQQGTDEIIQFDHLYMIRTFWNIDYIEESLKRIFKHKSLHQHTNRAGHTEWYENLAFDEFACALKEITESTKAFDIIKIPLKNAYISTKSTGCPLGSPSNSGNDKSVIREWQKDTWRKLNETAV